MPLIVLGSAKTGGITPRFEGFHNEAELVVLYAGL